jgi:hypothetical protein
MASNQLFTALLFVRACVCVCVRVCACMFVCLCVVCVCVNKLAENWAGREARSI